MNTNINVIDTHKEEVEWLEEHLKEAVELLESIATHTCMADSDVRKQLKQVYGWASDFLDEFNGETEDYSEYIGKLGWFCDSDKADDGFIDVLEEIEDGEYITRYDGAGYHHFRPLTADEVEDYTTFKVMKED